MLRSQPLKWFGLCEGFLGKNRKTTLPVPVPNPNGSFPSLRDTWNQESWEELHYLYFEKPKIKVSVHGDG
jgi:hypothetical protein